MDTFDAEVEAIRDRAKQLGLVVVAPYEKVIYEGEGADEEYQLVPTRQIEVYQETIRQLKGDEP